MRPIPLPPDHPSKDASTAPLVTTASDEQASTRKPAGLSPMQSSLAAGGGLLVVIVVGLIAVNWKRTPPAKPAPEKVVASAFDFDPEQVEDVNPADFDFSLPEQGENEGAADEPTNADASEMSAEEVPGNEPAEESTPSNSPAAESDSSASTSENTPPSEPSAEPSTKPDESPTPDPPPTPTKPAPTPKPVAKNPFEGFAKEISLPEIAADQPVQLGPVKIPDNFFCTLYLLGGNTAAHEHHLLSLEPRPDSERDWDLFGLFYGKTQPDKIGELTVRDQALWLTWNEESLEHPASAYLQNCALRISAGDHTHTVSLRKSILINKVPVLLEKQTRDWELVNLPRGDRVKVELQLVAPRSVPRTRFVGSAAIPVINGETFIQFGVKPGERHLILQVKSKLDSKGVHLQTIPWIQLTGQQKPLMLTDSNVQKLRQYLAATAGSLNSRLKSLGSGKGNAPARAQVSGQLSRVRVAENELKQLFALEKTLANQASLAVTITYLTEDLALTLLKTR